MDNTNINNYDVLWCTNKRIIMSKKYIQKPAEIPGGMRLEMMKDVEDKIITQQEYDKWLKELIDKNGTTKI